MSGHPDVELSEKTAELLCTTHYVTYHKAEHIDLGHELEETFVKCDGLSDVLSRFFGSFKLFRSLWKQHSIEICQLRLSL
jgi:hypothetical protein